MEIIDLTLTVSDEIPTFPGSPQPSFIPWENIKEDGYNLELLFLSTHTGTHMDAPYHFLEKGAKIHEISLNKLVSEAVLIQARGGRDRFGIKQISITKADIQKFEKQHGKIDGFSSVIFYTGWVKDLILEKQENQEKYYFTKNPGLSVSGAEYLASKKIKLVGIDSPSIDVGSDHKFSVHQIFAKKGILIVENLWLAQLFHRVHQTVEEKRNAMTFTLTSKGPRFQDPKTGKFQSPNKLPTCHLVVLPLKLKDATGSPVRAIAFVD
jgi:kynurenine formamidase